MCSLWRSKGKTSRGFLLLDVTHTSLCITIHTVVGNEQCYYSQTSYPEHCNPKITQTHHSQDGISKLRSKNSEIQVFAILLLVTFSFLILTTPAYLFFLSVMLMDFSKTPKLAAGYYLFYNTAHKMQVTNHGINFFLYVISGKKFRTDLKKLFLTSNKNKY